ncbi:MAG: MBL fold metallo-hydrolase, partial [Firmicutes bacterium]|nr:MBL fold metallo-hydrolase [Bacillota bacterium]
MKITNLPSGALQVNTYLAVDEETNKGFIVDPGGYNPVLTKKVKEENIDIEYIILTHGH